MFWPEGPKVYLAREPADLRKSIDGLSILVSQQLGEDPFSAQWFIFVNRRKNKLKALLWDRNGFVLYARRLAFRASCLRQTALRLCLRYKRLERAQFPWPAIEADQAALTIDQRQLQWLLSGLSIEQRQAHRAVSATAVA